MAAGGSARARGERARQEALELARRSREAYATAGRWQAAAAAERAVAATLLGLTALGWRLLVDRHWPGTRSANVDMILVGPGGVFIIDVKRWRDPPAVEDGHLLAGGARRDGEIGTMLAVTRTAEEQVAALGMSPVALRPLMVFARHRLDARLGRVRLLGHPDVVHALVAEPRRLTPAMVRVVADHLEKTFPAYEDAVLERAAPPPAGNGTGPAGNGEPAALFATEDVEKAARESLLHAPIEQWMTFLHPDQVGVARRDWSGPARISGPAGTGKTVVGLHRAAHLAGRGRGPILYVTFANNLPRVQEQLFGRMASTFAGRVEFTSLHGGLAGGSASLADAAVLCRARRETEHYHRHLTRAGVPVLRLEHYDGRRVESVKLGTYRRAKGLEFKYVFLPRHDAALAAVVSGDAADRERAELARRQLFVAMTRARDLLWLGSVAGGGTARGVSR